MTYAENLALAKEHNIDIAMLDIAHEVACCYPKGTKTKRFEDICRAVYNLWLDTYKISINQLVLALKDGIETQDCTLDDVLARGESWDLVIDLACQIDY